MIGEEALRYHRVPLPVREEARVCLHRCQTSLLPKANKPYSNKEEGQNDAEKELAADHVLNLMMFVRM